MNAIIEMIRRIKVVAVGLFTNGKTRPPSPRRGKLDGRRGYGDDDIAPPGA